MKDIGEVLQIVQIVLMVVILIYLIKIADYMTNPAWMRVLESWAG